MEFGADADAGAGRVHFRACIVHKDTSLPHLRFIIIQTSEHRVQALDLASFKN